MATACRSRFWSKALRKPWALLISLVLFLVVVEFRVMWQQFSDDNVIMSDVTSGDDDGGGDERGASNDGDRGSLLRDLEVLQQGYSFGGSHKFRGAPVSTVLQGPAWEPGGSKGGGWITAAAAREDGGDGAGLEGDSGVQRIEQDRGDGARGREAVREGEGTGEVVGQWHVEFVKKLGIKPHNKWIVLDVTSDQCGNIPPAPSGWRILLTGNSSRLSGCKMPWCVRVQPQPNDTNHEKGGDPSPLLGKTLAYLVAVSSGAQFILEADCTVSLKDAATILKVSNRGKEQGLMHNGTFLFNPYTHFGDWSAGPRALMSGASVPNNSRLYYIRDFDNNVLVKHGMNAFSDDVRVVGSSTWSRGARFDPSSPPVFLGQKSFSPAVPTSSLYRQKAFWALALPCQSRGPRCQVLRQLITQRLFRELDAFAGYYRLPEVTGPLPMQQTTGSVTDPGEVHKLASFLDRWRCHEAWKFFVCLESLADDLLARGGLISPHEQTVIKSWVAVLRNTSGVVEPDRVFKPWQGARTVSEIPATVGSMTSRLEQGGIKAEEFVRTNFVGVVAAAAYNCTNDRSCSSDSKKMEKEAVERWFPLAQWRRPVIEDVVLVVVFNNDRFFLHNLPFLETMHRPFFKNIVYCVSNVEGFLNDKENEMLRHVTLVEGMADRWFLMYECLTSVARMNIQGVRGYLHIGDDTLLNTWQLFNASLEAVWLPFGFTTVRAEEPKHPWDWYWWPKYRGRAAVLNALSRIEQLSGLTHEQLLQLDPNYNLTRRNPNSAAAKRRPTATFTDILTRAKKVGLPPPPRSLAGAKQYEEPSRQMAVDFLKLYYGNRMSGLVKHRAIDLFYIPQTLAPAFVSFSRLFLEQRVIIELAVPLIHYGLAVSSQVNYVAASSLWYNDRQDSYQHYDPTKTFLHPFKIKAEMSHIRAMTFFRDMYMKTLFTELSKRARR